MEASQSLQSPNNFKIPHPPKLPYLGNIHYLSAKNPTQSMMKLTKQFGPIMQIFTPFGSVIVLSNYEYVKEVLDESRFLKNISKPLLELRGLGGDGLFTSWTHEPAWQKAHNILLPGLGQRAMKGYYPMMLDIVERLLAKWHNIPEGQEFNLTEDMTRLTLDTIGFCGFDYRFHSFASDKPHPFVQNMLIALEDAMNRMNKLEFQKKLRFFKNNRNRKAENKLYSIVDEIIAERKKNPELYRHKTDLLSLMMNATDTVSGEKLDDINIRFQVITFLIAGHETTSGMLSFAFYYLLNHPEVLKKAYEEVDTVLGNDLNKKPSYREITELRYIPQILNESLRLWPTAPAFSLYATQDTTICSGKIHVPKYQPFIVLIPGLHRDSEIWGEHPDHFDPEHFSPENVEKRPADAFKPFGNGQRACIGRQFAMLEATLAIGMILQRYKLYLKPNYELKIKETLTLKPDDLRVSLELRKDSERTYAKELHHLPKEKIVLRTDSGKHQTPLLALFGSNMGASEDLALLIAQDAEKIGFQSQVGALDHFVDNLPQEGLLVIVCATYNGTPPENAVRFYEWLQSDLPAGLFHKLRFTVFGCGNRQWKTFQDVPRYIDQRLEELGGLRVYPRGEADASADFEEDFEKWYQGFWAKIREEFDFQVSSPENKLSPLALEIISEVQYTSLYPENRSGEKALKVFSNQELHQKNGSNPSDRSTRHIEIALAEGQHYRTGDHLGIYPQNSNDLIARVCKRFQLDPQTCIRLSSQSGIKSHLPINQPISLQDLLAHFVELQEPASRRQVKTLADYTECPPEKQKLLQWLAESEESRRLFKKEVTDKGLSVLDLLEAFSACEIPLAAYLEMLNPIKPRYFSISSSALKSPHICSITVGVVREEAWSGKGIFEGVCTNYLAQIQESELIQAYIQNAGSHFQLPENPKTPMILIGAGTGLAPLRGFLQERSFQKEQGLEVAKSLLFFGCRHPAQDFIYEEELKNFENQGIVQLNTAFSRLGQEKVYVQDRLKEQGENLWQLLHAGAIVYVCGDALRMAPAVRQALVYIYQNQSNSSAEEARLWLEEMIKSGRYREDVWA
ncbi:MAG: cytochrome P450 [Microscillaceae bacterium]|nr:cytochrome P450 [Microscillaceae bacterium]